MSNIFLTSTIENLPTELWYEIFKYFDAVELYRTFGNLNSKITSILSENVQQYVEITTTNSYDLYAHVILPAVNNPANIKSLKFYKEFQIEEFFTLWPISTFSQLRCLSLVYLGALMSDCSITLLEQLSSLVYFESLHIQVGSIISYDRCLKRLLQLIFVENYAFRSLKHFVLHHQNRICNRLALPTPAKQTILETIALPSLDREEFFELLLYAPHIKSIKTSWLYMNFTNTTSIIIPSLHSTLLKCDKMNLQLDRNWTFQDVEFLLQQVPNVNNLKFTSNYVLIDGNKWEILLEKNCPKLKIFELVCSDCYPELSSTLHNTFSSTFWLERNVQFVYCEKTYHWIVRFKI